MSAIAITITDRGRAALIASRGTNPITITQVGVTAANFTASPASQALPGEIKRLTTFSGEASDAYTIHITIRDDSIDDYELRGFALYLSDGTLFGIYGNGPALIMEKASASMLLLAVDIAFTASDAKQITFGNTNFLNPPATTERQGVVELATDSEAATGTDTTRAVTPKAMLSAVTGWINTRFGNGAPSDFIKSILGCLNAAALRSALGIKSAALKDEGAGNGLDADKLDGQDSLYYTNIPARLGYTPANKAGDAFTGTVTINGGQAWHTANDGAGSGLDADFLDGQDSSAFAKLSGATFTGTLQAPAMILGGGLNLPYAGDNLANNASGIRWQDGTKAASAFGFVISSGLWFQGSGDGSNPTFGVRAPTTDGSLGGSIFRVTPGSVVIGDTNIPGPNYLQIVHAGGDATSNSSYISFANSLSAPRGEFTLGTLGGTFGFQYGGAQRLSLAPSGQTTVYTNESALALGVNTTSTGAAWSGRVGAINTSGDRAVFTGIYNSTVATIAAHNSTLNGWTDLYINTVDGVNGGIVRLPAVTYISNNTAWHAGNDGAGSGLDADLFDGLHRAQLFNNSGQNHGTYKNFGDIPDFGVWYVHQDNAVTDGPAMGQFYVRTQGLGNEHPYSQYALMLATNRDNGNTYYRTREAGWWNAWARVSAGNADTVSSITNNTGLTRDRLAANNLIDGLTNTNFRSTIFGAATQGYNLAAARWNGTPSLLSGLSNYGTLVGWSGADTQGFLALSYSVAQAKIGGGSGDNIGWTATLWHDANDGSGCGMDADMLDGYHASTFLDGKCAAYILFNVNNGNVSTVASSGVTIQSRQQGGIFYFTVNNNCPIGFAIGMATPISYVDGINVMPPAQRMNGNGETYHFEFKYTSSKSLTDPAWALVMWF